jgi:plastocyanin
MDPWTTFLEITSKILTPVWNDLLQYMPLLLLGLVGLTVVGLSRVWSANAELNRPRVPQRITAGPMPPGVHLPGPSLWPFVLPIGGLFVLLSLVLHPQGLPVSPVLLGVGLVIVIAGVLGWYRDAGREWRRTELGAHAELASPAVPLIAERQPPPGVHLPGPSPWPFFAPIALLFLFAGLVFGPLLIVGGLVMGVVAALGWYLDAGHEYRQVDAGRLAEPRTRDPRRAFPFGVVKLYVAIAAIVVFITASPFIFSFLPSGGTAAPSAGGAATPSVEPEISASSAVSFDEKTLLVVAGQPLKLTFDNKQAGVPHNVGIYDSPAKAKEIFTGDHVIGPATVVYNVPALTAGTYYFQCDVHPNMNGTLTAK